MRQLGGDVVIRVSPSRQWVTTTGGPANGDSEDLCGPQSLLFP